MEKALSTTCQICSRPLSDPKSIKNGKGDVCAKKFSGILGTIGTSVEEINTLAKIDDPVVNRWVHLVARAIKARQVRDAARFLAAARHAGGLSRS